MANEEETNEEETKESAPAAGSNGLIGLFIMLGVVAVAAVAGFGLAKAFSGTGQAQAGDVSQQPLTADQTDAGGDDGDFQYYEFDQITANLDEPGLKRFVAAKVVIAVRQENWKEAKRLIEKRAPRLRNCLNAYFMSLTLQDVGGDKQLNRMMREIRDILNDELGGSKPLIDRVLVNKFAVQ